LQILRSKLLLSTLILIGFSIYVLNTALADESAAADEDNDEWFTRRQKTIMLNVGFMGGIFLHGLINWDYGDESWHFKSEGWFGRTTKYGGMDKLGHFWSGYTGSRLLAYIYRKWGYSDTDANLYGAVSTFGIQSFMEIADGFSSHGASWEDMVVNVAAVGAGYIWGKYPRLAEKIDFRVEYRPDFNSEDFDPFGNYENQRYLISIKADGFKAVKNQILKYGELHFGYYAHGYEDYNSLKPEDDDRKRTLFVGVGFNVTRLIQKWMDISVFNYFQIPYTSINFEYNLD
jgi:hypothetical protein